MTNLFENFMNGYTPMDPVRSKSEDCVRAELDARVAKLGKLLDKELKKLQVPAHKKLLIKYVGAYINYHRLILDATYNSMANSEMKLFSGNYKLKLTNQRNQLQELHRRIVTVVNRNNKHGKQFGDVFNSINSECSALFDGIRFINA